MQENERDEVLVAQHTSMDERVEVGQTCMLKMALEMPGVVDEMDDEVARLLVARWRKADRELEPRVRLAMIQLAGLDYGDDAKPWIEWAQKLP